PERDARAYLRATARGVLAEHWATHYALEMAEYAEDLMPSAPAPGGDEGSANRRRVTRLLARLPDHYRRVLELRFLRGLSVKETAREMEVTVANAKVLQWRALRSAAALEEERPGSAAAVPTASSGPCSATPGHPASRPPAPRAP